MKQFILFFGLLCFSLIGISQSKAIQRHGNFNSITKVDFKNYIGKEAFCFLLNDTIRKYDSFILIDEPPGILCGAKLYFKKENLDIDILVYNYKFLKKSSEERIWNIFDFYKENVDRIVVLYKGRVIIDTDK